MRNIRMGLIFEKRMQELLLPTAHGEREGGREVGREGGSGERKRERGGGTFFLDSLRRTWISQIHLHFGKSNIQPISLICEEPSIRFCHLMLNMEYIDSSFV